MIQNKNGEFVFSHQRLVVINLLSKGIGIDFTEEQLENAISEVDLMNDIMVKVEMEEDITIQDIFSEII